MREQVDTTKSVKQTCVGYVLQSVTNNRQFSAHFPYHVHVNLLTLLCISLNSSLR